MGALRTTVRTGMVPTGGWGSASAAGCSPSARSPRSKRSRLKPCSRPPGTHASMKSTTILAVRRDGKLAIAGDGQVTLDKTIVKHGARKVRRVAGGKVLAGFAGSAADGITLLEKFEGKMSAYKDNVMRAAV